MKPDLIEPTYSPSPRVTLTAGDRFRVSGGPYWRGPGGEKVQLGHRGVVTFLQARRTGRGHRCVLLEVFTAGGFAVLHVEGRRKSIDGSIVPRPYKVRARVRKPAPPRRRTKQ